MPATEAQKRAAKKWRDNNKEQKSILMNTWFEKNIEKKREHARKYANKKQLMLVACRELMRCLL
jgi:hypothetical protein